MLSDLHYQILKTVSEYNLASKNFISGNDLASMFHDDIFLTDDPVKFLIDSGYLEYSPAQNAKTYCESDEPWLKKEKQLKYDYDPCYHLRLTNTGRAVLDECSENNRKLSILERELAELSKLNETHKHLAELADKRITTLENETSSFKKDQNINRGISIFAGIACLAVPFIEYFLSHC